MENCKETQQCYDYKSQDGGCFWQQEEGSDRAGQAGLLEILCFDLSDGYTGVSFKIT